MISYSAHVFFHIIKQLSLLWENQFYVILHFLNFIGLTPGVHFINILQEVFILGSGSQKGKKILRT